MKCQRLFSYLPSQSIIHPVKIYRCFRSKYITVLKILSYRPLSIIPYLCDNLRLWLKNMITFSHPVFKQRNKNTKHNGPYNQQKNWRLQNNVKLNTLLSCASRYLKQYCMCILIPTLRPLVLLVTCHVLGELNVQDRWHITMPYRWSSSKYNARKFWTQWRILITLCTCFAGNTTNAAVSLTFHMQATPNGN